MNRAEVDSNSTLGKWWWDNSSDKASKEERIADLEQQVQYLMSSIQEINDGVAKVDEYAREDQKELGKHDRQIKTLDKSIVDLDRGVTKIWSWMYALFQQHPEFVNPDTVPFQEDKDGLPPYAGRRLPTGDGDRRVKIEPPPSTKKPTKRSNKRLSLPPSMRSFI